MRAVVQRVRTARVTSREHPEAPPVETGRIGTGLVALVGVGVGDDRDRAVRLADKIANLRVFDDGHGRMDRSCRDVGGAVLVVSQFTLYGDTRKGRRPSYVEAASPEVAEPLVDEVAAALRATGLEVATGRFRTAMEVTLTNDGPVTLLLEV